MGSQVANGKVVAGEYVGKTITAPIFGKPPEIVLKLFSMKKESSLPISSETVKSFEVMNQGSQKTKVGMGVAVVGIGRLDRGVEGVQVKIIWKDDKKSLIECNGEMLKAINKFCFDVE